MFHYQKYLTCPLEEEIQRDIFALPTYFHHKLVQSKSMQDVGARSELQGANLPGKEVTATNEKLTCGAQSTGGQPD